MLEVLPEGGRRSQELSRLSDSDLGGVAQGASWPKNAHPWPPKKTQKPRFLLLKTVKHPGALVDFAAKIPLLVVFGGSGMTT